MSLSHFDSSGASRMVNVGEKEISERLARAEGFVRMKPSTLLLIRDRKLAKGDVLEVARLAGIMGSKQTANLIPLCHPLGLDSIELQFDFPREDTLRIECTASVHARTGVEMETLTGVSLAALTVYDMCKAIDREMSIGPIHLLEKLGGKSGHYQRASTDHSRQDP